MRSSTHWSIFTCYLAKNAENEASYIPVGHKAESFISCLTHWMDPGGSWGSSTSHEEQAHDFIL